MSRSETLISVIIPAYNYAHLLPRALDSVLRQINDDIELIVVNDGSTDATAAVLEDYQQRYPQLQVIHQDNAGAAAARNHGIRQAHGRYALLLDADDELLPDALDSLRNQLQKTSDAALLLGGQISVYPDGRGRFRNATPVPSVSSQELIRRYLLEKSISISHCCSLFRRDLLLQCPYPENLRSGEDIAVFAYLLVQGNTKIVDVALARIYKHATSLRHNRDREEEYALAMVDAVFSCLPEDCQSLRQRYTAQRYLSLFRAAQNAKDYLIARRYYKTALCLSPAQALRWSYLKKALRCWVGF